eukprot:CAMPEP_0177628590 /NCGR_PEP_ID=MMETSP0447-20121125/212_1 /TAXON_ID=0 /ORGANISM="Stygamoeba regulata, Strain BSH-02190019" /LENGTH=406 /DNA_ID=CAMNT_0019129847 /DNA_START=289 /DNA_END=1505 /DNA_ORIENTATION=-
MDIEKIVTSNAPKSTKYSFLHPWLGKGLLTNNDYTDWKVKRRLLTPAFHFDVLILYRTIFGNNSQRLYAMWEKQMEKEGNQEEGIVVDMQDEMAFLSLDNIGECAFGISFDAINNRNSDFVEATLAMSRLLVERVANPLLQADIVYSLTPSSRKMQQALHVLNSYCDNAISKRQREINEGQEATRQKYFLDILLTSRTESGESLTLTEIRDEVNTFMFEGHDTTSSGLMWCLYDIATRPKVYAGVMAEMEKVLGGKPADHCPTNEELGQLKYLQMVIKESHRFHSPVPSVARCLTEPMELSGYTVPAGTNVAVQPMSVHFNPVYWPDPFEFIPERFTPEASKGRHPFQYVPFSAGRRNCIGQNFALLEERIVLATLLRRFHVAYAGDGPQEYAELVLRNQGPLPFR